MKIKYGDWVSAMAATHIDDAERWHCMKQDNQEFYSMKPLSPVSLPDDLRAWIQAFMQRSPRRFDASTPPWRLLRAAFAGRQANLVLSGKRACILPTPWRSPIYVDLPKATFWVVLRSRMGGRTGVYWSSCAAYAEVNRHIVDLHGFSDVRFADEAIIHSWPSLSEVAAYLVVASGGLPLRSENEEDEDAFVWV